MIALTFLVVALVFLCVAFAVLWAVCRWVDNYGLVDAGWALAFAAVAVFYAWYGPGWFLRNFTIAALAVLWSVRLGSHLFTRALRHHPAEDGRYAQLRKDWAGNLDWRMFGFFQLQALSVILLSLPFLLPALNRTVNFHSFEVAGVVLWFVGLYGEALADGQLAAFQRDPANRGRVCEVGLWRYSRHPNYFFEWLVWLGFAVFALGSPFGWLALTAPTAILYLLLCVTGLPRTEAQAVRSHGEAYRRYQESTRAFVPWFRRRPPPKD